MLSYLGKPISWTVSFLGKIGEDAVLYQHLWKSPFVEKGLKHIKVTTQPIHLFQINVGLDLLNGSLKHTYNIL